MDELFELLPQYADEPLRMLTEELRRQTSRGSSEEVQVLDISEHQLILWQQVARQVTKCDESILKTVIEEVQDMYLEDVGRERAFEVAHFVCSQNVAFTPMILGFEPLSYINANGYATSNSPFLYDVNKREGITIDKPKVGKEKISTTVRLERPIVVEKKFYNQHQFGEMSNQFIDQMNQTLAGYAHDGEDKFKIECEYITTAKIPETQLGKGSDLVALSKLGSDAHLMPSKLVKMIYCVQLLLYSSEVRDGYEKAFGAEVISEVEYYVTKAALTALAPYISHPKGKKCGNIIQALMEYGKGNLANCSLFKSCHLAADRTSESYDDREFGIESRSFKQYNVENIEKLAKAGMKLDDSMTLERVNDSFALIPFMQTKTGIVYGNRTLFGTALRVGWALAGVSALFGDVDVSVSRYIRLFSKLMMQYGWTRAKKINDLNSELMDYAETKPTIHLVPEAVMKDNNGIYSREGKVTLLMNVNRPKELNWLMINKIPLTGTPAEQRHEWKNSLDERFSEVGVGVDIVNYIADELYPNRALLITVEGSGVVYAAPGSGKSTYIKSTGTAHDIDKYIEWPEGKWWLDETIKERVEMDVEAAAYRIAREKHVIVLCGVPPRVIQYDVPTCYVDIDVATIKAYNWELRNENQPQMKDALDNKKRYDAKCTALNLPKMTSFNSAIQYSKESNWESYDWEKVSRYCRACGFLTRAGFVGYPRIPISYMLAKFSSPSKICGEQASTAFSPLMFSAMVEKLAKLTPMEGKGNSVAGIAASLTKMTSSGRGTKVKYRTTKDFVRREESYSIKINSGRKFGSNKKFMTIPLLGSELMNQREIPKFGGVDLVGTTGRRDDVLKMMVRIIYVQPIGLLTIQSYIALVFKDFEKMYNASNESITYLNQAQDSGNNYDYLTVFANWVYQAMISVKNKDKVFVREADFPSWDHHIRTAVIAMWIVFRDRLGNFVVPENFLDSFDEIYRRLAGEGWLYTVTDNQVQSSSPNVMALLVAASTSGDAYTTLLNSFVHSVANEIVGSKLRSLAAGDYEAFYTGMLVESVETLKAIFTSINMRETELIVDIMLSSFFGDDGISKQLAHGDEDDIITLAMYAITHIYQACGLATKPDDLSMSRGTANMLNNGFRYCGWVRRWRSTLSREKGEVAPIFSTGDSLTMAMSSGVSEASYIIPLLMISSSAVIDRAYGEHTEFGVGGLFTPSSDGRFLSSIPVPVHTFPGARILQVKSIVGLDMTRNDMSQSQLPSEAASDLLDSAVVNIEYLGVSYTSVRMDNRIKEVEKDWLDVELVERSKVARVKLENKVNPEGKKVYSERYLDGIDYTKSIYRQVRKGLMEVIKVDAYLSPYMRRIAKVMKQKRMSPDLDIKVGINVRARFTIDDKAPRIIIGRGMILMVDIDNKIMSRYTFAYPMLTSTCARWMLLQLVFGQSAGQISSKVTAPMQPGMFDAPIDEAILDMQRKDGGADLDTLLTLAGYDSKTVGKIKKKMSRLAASKLGEEAQWQSIRVPEMAITIRRFRLDNFMPTVTEAGENPGMIKAFTYEVLGAVMIYEACYRLTKSINSTLYGEFQTVCHIPTVVFI